MPASPARTGRWSPSYGVEFRSRASRADAAYNRRMTEIVVRIPAALQAFAGGQRELRAAPGTVAVVLQQLSASHPQLVQRLLTPEGDLRPFVNVFVGRVNVRELRGLATRVIEGEVITILPAVAGG